MNAITDLGHRAVEGTRLMLLNIGLLVLRLGAGGFMAYGHGWVKLAGYSKMSATFSNDILGIGSAPTLILAIFAELICAVAIALGLLTRIATIPLIVTMAVAAFVYHSGDEFKVQEPALLYLTMYVTLALAGPGRYSLDALLFNRRPKPKT